MGARALHRQGAMRRYEAAPWAMGRTLARATCAQSKSGKCWARPRLATLSMELKLGLAVLEQDPDTLQGESKTPRPPDLAQCASWQISAILNNHCAPTSKCSLEAGGACPKVMGNGRRFHALLAETTGRPSLHTGGNSKETSIQPATGLDAARHAERCWARTLMCPDASDAALQAPACAGARNKLWRGAIRTRLGQGLVLER